MTRIHRDQNNLTDKLVIAALTLQPSVELLNGDDKLEINFRPSVLDNMEHWQIFHDDEHILKFVHNIEEFSNFNVSFQEEGKEYQGKGDQFDNPVPRGLVSLENIFDRKDRRKAKIDSMKPGDYLRSTLEQIMNQK